MEQQDSYKYTKKLHLQKADILIDEYEKAKHFYYIESGVAAVNIVQDYQEYISAFVLPGDICGIDSISTAITKKHSISVISKELVCCRIQAGYFIESCSGNKEILSHVLGQFGNILQRHYDVFDLVSQPLDTRVWQTLVYLGNNMGEKRDDRCIYLPEFVTQGVLARFCRTTQPHISKQFQQLEADGKIKRKTSPIAFIPNEDP